MDFDNTPVSDRRPPFGYAPEDPTGPPATTIITPVFNVGPVFEETAESVRRQSLQQWEWLIINDASTDPAFLDILDNYRNRDPRIRVIDHPENRGLSAARNTGFREARAEYCVLLDGDDLLEPTALEKWLWFLEAYPEWSFVQGHSAAFGSQQYVWEAGFCNGAENLAVNQIDHTSMVRKSAHEAAHGFDESIREGLEDWDFWLRCANAGLWGATLPEVLSWYRRRDNQSESWPNLEASRRQDFGARLKEKYPRLWEGRFPQIAAKPDPHYAPVTETLPCRNRLTKDRSRLIMIVPWLALGGADKFNLDLLDQLTRAGWNVTIVTTLPGANEWRSLFEQHTSDLFVLSDFLRLADTPRFMDYLIESRRPDVVMVTNSDLGYHLLPYLRARHPAVCYVNYEHAVDPFWKNGGCARLAVSYQEFLDLNIVASEDLKHWMVEHGADATRVKVCYIGVDTETWHPDPELAARTRKALGVEADTPLILYAARLYDVKQPAVFAEVMHRLHALGVPFRAVVAGDGPDRGLLEGLIAEHGLAESVTMEGAVTAGRVRQLMAAADIFFLPSKSEGIALTVFEAMASGTPPVCADVGGQRELVVPECGILVQHEPGEVEAYVAALKQLLTDPGRRATMAQAARDRTAALFSSGNLADRLTQLFQLVSEQVPRPTPTPATARTLTTEAVELARAEREIADLHQQCGFLAAEAEKLLTQAVVLRSRHLQAQQTPWAGAFRTKLQLSAAARRVPSGHVRVRPLGEHATDGQGNEVWLLGVTPRNGTPWDLHEVVRHGPWTWQPAESAPLGVALVSSATPGHVDIPLGPEPVELLFAAHPWCGLAEVLSGSGRVLLDLYSPRSCLARVTVENGSPRLAIANTP